MRYLHTRLGKDTTSDVIAAVPRRAVVQECVQAQRHSRRYLRLSTDRYTCRFLLVLPSDEAVLQEATIYRRRQRLKEMTASLEPR